MDGHWDGNYGNPTLLQEATTLTRRAPQHKAGRWVPQVPTSFNTKNGLVTWIYLDGLGVTAIFRKPSFVDWFTMATIVLLGFKSPKGSDV